MERDRPALPEAVPPLGVIAGEVVETFRGRGVQVAQSGRGNILACVERGGARDENDHTAALGRRHDAHFRLVGEACECLASEQRNRDG